MSAAAAPRRVTPGFRAGGEVEIVEGPRPGERVATGGASLPERAGRA